MSLILWSQCIPGWAACLHQATSAELKKLGAVQYYVHWKLVRKSIWCESRISTSLACRTASQQASDCLEWALHYDKSPLLYQIWPALPFFPRWMTLGLLLCIQLYSHAGFGFFRLRLWILIVGWHTCVRPHASCQLSNLSQYLYTIRRTSWKTALLDVRNLKIPNDVSIVTLRWWWWHLSFLNTHRWWFFV